MDDRERRENKKLSEAGRHWYGIGHLPPRPERPAVDENVLDGMRRTGATAEQIAEVVASWEDPDEPEADDDFEVYADNWESVMFFLGLETQWSYTSPGMGRPRLLGLPSTCIESDMNMRCVPKKRRPELLADLRACERGALRAQSQAIEEQQR